MSQNSQRLAWTAEKVDDMLKHAMKNIYDISVDAAARYGLGYDLIAGANIAGFEKVAEAMLAQGVY
jgi:glutamate dehydrogenase (NADP+)